jgi:hypothetical protein
MDSQIVKVNNLLIQDNTYHESGVNSNMVNVILIKLSQYAPALF